MKSVITVLVSSVILFAASVASAEDPGSCQSQYYTCLTSPTADISACITQNQQCLNSIYTTQLQQEQQAYQNYLQQQLAAFYGNPSFIDPWTSALLGYNPALLSAAYQSAQEYAFEQQAIQNYFSQQLATAQSNQAQVQALIQLLSQP